MLKQIMSILLIYISVIVGMDKEITQIDLNPITHPQAFFNELDNRIISQVKSAEIVCIQRDITALSNHLNNIAALLTKAEEHAPEFQKAYEELHPTKGALKRSQNNLCDTSLQQVIAFRMQTSKLIEALTSITEGPITDKEWSLMGRLFKAISTEEASKKPRIVSDK